MYETGLLDSDKQGKAKAIEWYEAAAFKVPDAKERLIALDQPLPKGVEEGVEHILVTPQDLHNFLDDQLTLLQNTPAPKVGTGSRVSGQTCAKMMSCSTLGGGEAQRMYTEVQRLVGMSIANQFRLE